MAGLRIFPDFPDFLYPHVSSYVYALPNVFGNLFYQTCYSHMRHIRSVSPDFSGFFLYPFVSFVSSIDFFLNGLPRLWLKIHVEAAKRLKDARTYNIVVKWKIARSGGKGF
jgi:hypothetical protein